MESNKKGIEKLQSEFRELRKDGLSGIGGSAGIINKNYLHWKACFIGPTNSPYNGGLYYIQIKCNENYPVEPPEVKFKTKIWHPNITEEGRICIDYLNNWQKTYNIRGIVTTLFDLLGTPNFESPYNSKTHENNKMKSDFEKIAKEYNSKYAVQNQDIKWEI